MSEEGAAERALFAEKDVLVPCGTGLKKYKDTFVKRELTQLGSGDESANGI